MEASGSEIGGKLPWLVAARWFPAKGSDGRIVLHDVAQIPEGGSPRSETERPTWVGIVELVRHDASGESPRLFLPLSAADGGFEDAGRSDGFVRWLLQAVLAEESLSSGGGIFQGHVVSRETPHSPTSPLSIADVGGDASNTSLAVSWSAGRAVMVKIVRRCRAGIHPEVEVGRFLSGAAVRADVPRLVGWLDYVPRVSDAVECGGPATVAILHEWVDARGSAWDAMMASAAADWPRCLAIVTSLGETTARLHAALASRNDDPAFAAEPWTAEAWAAAVRAMADHADRVFDRVGRLLATAPTLVPGPTDLASMRSRIAAEFAEQAARPPSSPRIRVHGDYHLGQVLVGRDNERCIVVDFEGEPGRTLLERRQKTSAAKDVAGMCRSFDYLLRVLAKEGRRPYDVGDLESLESRFLSTYETVSQRLAADRPGATWWSQDRREADRLLELFKIDKALYELAYEADHRPDWIDVPLAAVAARASGPVPPEACVDPRPCRHSGA